MHYLISKALRYGPCVTRDHIVLPAMHPHLPLLPSRLTALKGYTH